MGGACGWPASSARAAFGGKGVREGRRLASRRATTQTHKVGEGNVEEHAGGGAEDPLAGVGVVADSNTDEEADVAGEGAHDVPEEGLADAPAGVEKHREVGNLA